jgi:steroid 5-alpha reductase family enzyme
MNLMVIYIYKYINIQGWYPRKLLIAIPFILCGLRFMLGWTFGRKHYKHEDHRWNLWRERWNSGEGVLGLKSEQINFFFFYHAQSLTNVFVLSLPLTLMYNNSGDKYFHFLEIIGIVIWTLSFFLENLADVQLSKFRMSKSPGVMNKGLWKYSRHPNYFFEWMIWVSYVIMSIPSITEQWQIVAICFLPIVAYYFLVHFTGVPITEKASLKKRGEVYRQYQENTNMFFPWFPKNNKLETLKQS